MRACTIIALVLTAFVLAACGGSDKDAPLAPSSERPEVPGPAPGNVAPPAGGLDQPDETSGDQEAPDGTDPIGSGPEAPDAIDPIGGGPDTPDVVDPIGSGPDVLEPSVGLFELPLPWGANEPLIGSYLDVGSFPFREVVSGGPPKDGIPALNNPTFVGALGVNYLSENDLVLGVVINGEARAYPHNIGWWHEIVNDVVGDHPISVTFCPLTGTGLVFDAEDENGGQFELGVSGLLFNNNLIMYDRRDDTSLYPQIYFTGVQGPRTGESLKLLPVVETTWATWKRLHPDTRVIAGNTGWSRDYTRYPYGGYRTNDDAFLFGLNPSLPSNLNDFASAYGAKDGVLGVRLNGQAMAYSFADMGAQAVVNHQVGGVDIAVVWDQANYLAIPYARYANGQTLSFDLELSSGFPFNLRDRETGTLWDIKGTAVEGPLAGAQLTQVPAHNSFWFAWVTFWQDTGVWQPGTL